MSVVKALALGASILGSLVAPTLAGSIRASHRIPDRPHPSSVRDAPTSLVIAPAAEVLAAAENLATLGASAPSQTYATSSYAGPPVAAGSLSLGNVNQSLATFAAQPVAFAPAPAPVPIVAPAPVAAPIVAPAPAAVSVAAPAAPAPSVAVAAAAATAGHTVDAFINFGNAPYSEAQSLTTGGAQVWYQSPSVQSVFHGTPTAAQQAAFENEVLQVAQSTYAKSGLNVSLTTDPTQNYAHTMSVVAGTSYAGNSQAIGITDVGNDGFSFIDKLNQAKSPDELAEAVGHNIAHELMHAFGIAIHPDQTGTYLDAASASWSVLTNTATTFSPQAVQLLSTENFLNGPGKEFTQGSLGISGLELLTAHHPVTCHCPLCNALRALKAAAGLSVGASPVPEPTTVALWGAAVAGIVVARRRRNGKNRA